MASVTRWTFEDLTTSETYIFPINPVDATIPSITKTLVYSNTSAPNGKAIAFEGRDEVQKGSFTGKILSEQQYNDFETWANKRHQLIMTDDLGRAYSIYITDISFKRLRRSSNFWLHDYTVNFIIVDWD